MKFKWSYLMTLLAFTGILMFAGCADDDDDGNGGGGPQPSPLIGTWSALPASAGQLGADELRYFLRNDSTFLFYQRFQSTELRESGTWRATSDSIYFHETSQDNVPQDTTYARWYDLSANRDTLFVRYLYDQLYTVTYVKED